MQMTDYFDLLTGAKKLEAKISLNRTKLFLVRPEFKRVGSELFFTVHYENYNNIDFIFFFKLKISTQRQHCH